MPVSLPEMISVKGPGFSGLVAPHLVAASAFKLYLASLDHPASKQLMRCATQRGPICWVPQLEAVQYCLWLGRQHSRPYRLPSMAELIEFFSESAAQGISPDLWPADAARRTADLAGHEANFCEWTRETDVLPGVDGADARVMGSIFYPPWLRSGNNAAHLQAHMQASEGYSFVGFRVACDAS